MLVIWLNQQYIEFSQVNWSTPTKQIKIIHQTYRIVIQKEHNKHQCWKKTSIPHGILKFSTLIKFLAKTNSRENANVNLKGDIYTFLEGFKIFMSSDINTLVEILQCCLILLQSSAPNQLRENEIFLKNHLHSFFSGWLKIIHHHKQHKI